MSAGRAWMSLAGLLLAAGCASPPDAQLPDAQRYGCERDIVFGVRFAADSAEIDLGARGRELLGLDAGGVNPDQTVYSNARLRAAFGPEAERQQAELRFLGEPLAVRCRRL